MSDRKERIYIAIDLKSFYASVECVQRGLDPLNTCLVVADKSRTNKTICLAVSPALKAFGVPGRPRLFEVEKIIADVNRERAFKSGVWRGNGKSHFYDELSKDLSLEVDYLVATPRMQYYIETSDKVYETYLKYISADDIHVYSIDEVFMDVTDYLNTYKMTPHQLAMTMIKDVLNATGVTATAGIGTNMYLAKVAMDIVAKHLPADKDGVRIAELDEISYREKLWTHEPLKDFWRVGRGYARRLEKYGITTMGDIARFSLENSETLFKEFGINAELLIDHAWGYEPTRISDIKSYHSDNHSLGSGQVLMRPYSFEEAKIVVKEMIDALALELHAKGCVTDRVSLAVNYDTSNDLKDFQGTIVSNYIGRRVPKPGNGSAKLKGFTSSANIMRQAIMEIYGRVVDPELLIRRINVVADHVLPRKEAENRPQIEEYDLFSDPEKLESEHRQQEEENEKDTRLQDAMLKIQGKYGKNSVMTATSTEDAATGRERNMQIGGHKK
ncbi:MAG: DNA methylase [Erysipelotrichaceae bacterium]|nr:DNA methylase [Erysipelotrichaceae bacterium]